MEFGEVFISNGALEMALDPQTELRVVDLIRQRTLSESRTDGLPASATRELDALAEAYRQGGRSALAGWTGDPQEWLYWRLETATDGTHDSLLNARLLPVMTALVEANAIDNWWFLRKPYGGPHLRLRLHPAPGADVSALAEELDTRFGSWKRDSELVRFSRIVYEPEVSIFGGDAGMEISHELFYRDSVGYCHNAPLLTARGFQFSSGVSAALLAGFFQHAGLDWFEQGDVWRIVCRLRAATLPDSVTKADAKPVARLRSIFSDTDSIVAEATADLPEMAEWHLAFKELGRTFARTDAHGGLTTGLRRIMAVHIIFHWNRMGFSFAQQALLSQFSRKATRWAT